MRFTHVPGNGAIVDLPYVPTVCVEALDEFEKVWPGATDPEMRVYLAASILLGYAEFNAKRLEGEEQRYLEKADGSLVPRDCVLALEKFESFFRGASFPGARLAIVDAVLTKLATSDEIEDTDDSE